VSGQLSIKGRDMKNLPISMKFLAVLGMLAAFTVAAVGFVAWQMYAIGTRAQQVNNTVVLAATELSEASGSMEKIRAAMEYMLLSTSAQNVAAAGNAISVSQRDVDTRLTGAGVAVPGQRAQLQDLRDRTDALLATAECKEVESLGANSGAASPAIINDFAASCAPGFVPVTHDMEAQRDTLSKMAAQELAGLKIQTDRTVLITFIGVLSGFVLVALIGYFGMGRWVVRPLAGLRAAMERLARGDFSITLDTLRHDEVGAMARSVQVFRDAAREKERLEAAAAATARLAEAERERGELAREAAAASQALVVESVADGLERLSKGDLLYRLHVNFAPEYEKLRMDFNQAMETLENTMQGIAANTHGVRSGAAEITRSSDDLSRRTERQAASLEETAAALDEINVTVGKTAQGANEARDVVNTAKSDAERSGSIVSETVTAMQEIETSSKQISSIIGVIDEIAFQTNLLALNAGVEAARAGDAGRGFAVVATEVRALAQRSADAAKEIKTLISASGTQVEAGVRLVGETGKALTRIVDQVGRLSDLVTNIASSAQEQAVGLGQVNSAVNQMDQVTQQNATMVEEATAASHALAAEAEELARLVSQFRVGEGAARPALAVPSQRSAARPARTASVAAPAGKFVALPSITTTSDAGEWDEF
jgi:methyl-accepting chemotaxis protein